MMKKKKKQSRSQSSTKEPSPDSSPSPRLLSIFRSKLVSGKDLKHMFRGMRTKTAPGLSSQSRIVRCPKCHKLLQEPIDATIYKCSGCDSILQAKRWELESNGDSIPEALLYSQNRSLSTQLESAEGGSKTPMRSISRASHSVDRGYHSETVYKTSDINREWMKRADEFSVTGDSDAFASARSSPYNSRSNAASDERRHQVPFYPASPSPSSAYEYGYSSPFHGSQASASEQSYYHHQTNQFKQKDREGWFQESPAASPSRFPGETSDGRYYHSSSKSQLHDHRYDNLYEPSSSLYSERSYQADTAPLRSTYSEQSKSGTSSEKRSQRGKKKYVRKKKPVVKRYVLPSAGGAPFATCSYCLELLQLPQVSLHGKHKMYQVRCGSCSGVLKFSVREKEGTVLDSHSLAEETVTNNQEDSHLSCSDNGSGDRICKSNDAVNIETLEDKGSKEDIRSISSTLLDWKLNHKLREQQPTSSESIGEASRNHVEQSEEARSEKSTEMDNNIPVRVSCEEYEKNEIIKPEAMFGDVLGESLEVQVYKKETKSDSDIEAERPVSHSGPENIGDSQEFDWEENQENEECEGEGEGKWEDIMGDKPGLVLEKSLYVGDSICDSSSSNGELYEDTSVKEDTKHISVAPQFPLESLVDENQMFIGQPPDQSGEAIVTTSRIHEEQYKYEHENLSEIQELDKTISDNNVRYELEESRYEKNEALATDKVSEDVVSLTEASETFKTSIEGETGEERSVSHLKDSPNENVEDIYERLEYAGERTWEDTKEDRAVLHLEEYERNYSKPFEWASEGAEPEEGADGRLESSSRGSFSDHENAEESVVFEESQDAKSDQSQYEYELPSEKQELSSTVVDTERHEIEEDRYESNETFEPAKMVGDGAVVSLEKVSETNIGETGEEERSVSHHMDTENENLEAMGDGAEFQLEESLNNPHEWTSERAPTFRLQEYELGTVPASEKDAYERPSRSTDESSEEKCVAHEEPSLVDENKNKEQKVTLMVEDEAALYLEKCRNDSMILEETFEWTERAPTWSEQGTMLEPDEEADERSESRSTGSFHNHESSESRAVLHEEEQQLMSDGITEMLQLHEMTEDMVSLELEKGGNESIKLEETFERTTERAPTFRLHESDLGTMLEPNEDADGRSESSSTQKDIDQEEEPRLETVSRTKPQQEGQVAKDMVSLHLECETESMNLDRTFEWSSERALTFRRREYDEPGTMPEPDEASESQESPSKTAKVDSDTEEDIVEENDKSGLTSEPYSHFYNTTDPSEIVGLRLALYETQTSPLSSPMHTPMGSPLHILMRSPIASPMHSHIVSPMRSPINSSGSLSDVLFFGKKA